MKSAMTHGSRIYGDKGDEWGNNQPNEIDHSTSSRNGLFAWWSTAKHRITNGNPNKNIRSNNVSYLRVRPYYRKHNYWRSKSRQTV